MYLDSLTNLACFRKIFLSLHLLTCECCCAVSSTGKGRCNDGGVCRHADRAVLVDRGGLSSEL